MPSLSPTVLNSEEVKQELIDNGSITHLEIAPLTEGTLSVDITGDIQELVEVHKIFGIADSVEATLHEFEVDYVKIAENIDTSKVVNEELRLRVVEGMGLLTLSKQPRGDIISIVISIEGEDLVIDKRLNIRGNVVEIPCPDSWHRAIVIVKYITV